MNSEISLTIFCLVFAVAGLVLMVLMQPRDVAMSRLQHLRSWARRQGFRFRPHRMRGFDEEFREFECFQKGFDRYACNVIEGDRGGVALRGFDWHYQQSILDAMDGTHRATHAGSVLIANVDLELEPMKILPHNRAETLELPEDWEELGDLDAGFDQRYVVECMDEDSARKVMDGRVIQVMIQDSADFCVECNRAGVAVFYPGHLFNFEDYNAARTLVMTLVEAALALEAEPAAEEIEEIEEGEEGEEELVEAVSWGDRTGVGAVAFRGNVVHLGMPKPRRRAAVAPETGPPDEIEERLPERWPD